MKKRIDKHKKDIQRVFEKRRDVYLIMKGMDSDSEEFARLDKSIRFLDGEVKRNSFEIARLSREGV